MSDFQAQLEKARGILPLRRVIEQAGKAPANGKWNRFPECPFCHEKQKAGVFMPDSDRFELFKCFQDTCPAHTAVV